jgi:hypothetical protein
MEIVYQKIITTLIISIILKHQCTPTPVPLTGDTGKSGS